MQPLLNIGVRAARRAADLIVRSLNRLDSLDVSSKGRNDFVTDVDRAAEAEIVATIRKSYPDHAFLCEESGASGSGPVQWIVDPLDGTTNFLHGFPTFCISIACRVRDRLEHAVIYDPMRQEVFTASQAVYLSTENSGSAMSSASSMKGFVLGTILNNVVSSQVVKSLKPQARLLQDTCTYNVEILLSGCYAG